MAKVKDWAGEAWAKLTLRSNALHIENGPQVKHRTFGDLLDYYVPKG
jgi:hypothetical protein